MMGPDLLKITPDQYIACVKAWLVSPEAEEFEIQLCIDNVKCTPAMIAEQVFHNLWDGCIQAFEQFIPGFFKPKWLRGLFEICLVDEPGSDAEKAAESELLRDCAYWINQEVEDEVMGSIENVAAML